MLKTGNGMPVKSASLSLDAGLGPSKNTNSVLMANDHIDWSPIPSYDPTASSDPEARRSSVQAGRKRYKDTTTM